jgi:inorganic pyrophosphatase
VAVIEIARGSNVKYELDEHPGLLRMDRVPYSAVFFPANYGSSPRLWLRMAMDVPGIP